MEKPGSSPFDSCSALKNKPVILTKKLFNLLSSVTKIELVTTVKEILDGLKIYIVKKQLYDPQDPMRIKCENDELGSIFGVQEFSIPEVVLFLSKLITPVCSRVDTKKCIHDEIIIYIPPSPTRGNLSSDSAESFQGYETAFAKDTSDESISLDGSDDNFSILAVEETYNIEYEVDSLSSQSNDSWSDGDSETDTLSSAIITVICKGDSDMEFWADKSSDDDFYDCDAEISDSDKWKCSTCRTLNDPPNRFCGRCFGTRKGWLANKIQPAKRKSISKRNKVTASNRAKQKESTQNNPINLCEFPSTSSACQENKPQCTETGKKQSNNCNFDTHSNFTSKLCFLCCERPANGTIIHNHTKFAHTVACYQCAKKLKNLKKPCPICRRSIDRVVCQISG